MYVGRIVVKSKIDRTAILAVVAGVLLFAGLLVWTNNPGKGQNSEFPDRDARPFIEKALKM